jgi:hypothetical protein
VKPKMFRLTIHDRARLKGRCWSGVLIVALLLAGLWPAMGQLLGRLDQTPALVQVCTHAGLAWVQQGDPAPQGDSEQALFKDGCVWSAAQISLPCGLGGEPLGRCAAPEALLAGDARSVCWPSGFLRVLLMAPMRAPPVLFIA